MFLLVFGLQEGHQLDWGTVTGPITVWRLIIAGVFLIAAFIWWQRRNRREPLMPLGLFADRFGFATLIGSMVGLSFAVRPETPLWALLVALGFVGLGSSFLWAPLSATANRNLPMHQAGAGAGVHNANRQVGAVLGSAAIAVLLDARLSAQGLGSSPAGAETATGAMPAAVLDKFSEAMGQSLLLVPFVLVLGLLAALAFERPRHFASR